MLRTVCRKKNSCIDFVFSACIPLLILSLLFTGCHKPLTAEPLPADNGDTTATTPPPPPVPDYNRPNIILIVGDDIGYEVPGYTGGESYTTPNLDKMAATGMQFKNCFSTPLCSPSRVMLLTGKYNFRNYTQWGRMDINQKTFVNMLQDAGYATYVAGKWQLDGGETSIHTFGFDDYCVWNPYEAEPFHPNWRRYKDPDIYINGAYLPREATNGKYSEDIFCDSIFSFMNNHLNQPFFIYYPMSLPHAPFYPTPDDPEFASWVVGKNPSDAKFFPSMIKYMDKKIGQLTDKVNEMGLANKTIIIYIGDNGTDNSIVSQYNGQSVRGGKGLSNDYGTHVPMLAVWPGVIPAASINADLVDFTDFLPTIADLSQTRKPITYGTLDGVSFFERLMNNPGTPRTSVYCYFNPARDATDTLKEWIQNKDYKLYNGSEKFYNYVSDELEKNPLQDAILSPAQAQLKLNLDSVMHTLHN